ncbi:MAG TPA: hypothetical protein GX713_00820 [Mollicutes bacterium]|nr:hypothetical protein [Mollicutes bacterium]
MMSFPSLTNEVITLWIVLILTSGHSSDILLLVIFSIFDKIILLTLSSFVILVSEVFPILSSNSRYALITTTKKYFIKGR